MISISAQQRIKRLNNNYSFINKSSPNNITVIYFNYPSDLNKSPFMPLTSNPDNKYHMIRGNLSILKFPSSISSVRQLCSSNSSYIVLAIYFNHTLYSFKDINDIIQNVPVSLNQYTNSIDLKDSLINTLIIVLLWIDFELTPQVL